MKFVVQTARPTRSLSDTVVLQIDRWDDFGYKTLFTAWLTTPSGVQELGGVKIARADMTQDGGRVEVPSKFSFLDQKFFSLGQDASYYENLKTLGKVLSDEILTALRDVARDLDLFDAYLDAPVMQTSLLRSVEAVTVKEQFHRIASGGERAQGFSFAYVSPTTGPGLDQDLRFTVEPSTTPPTNIHAIIGGNGVGKTRLLQRIASALIDSSASRSRVGALVDTRSGAETSFTNLVYVSFSAFDSAVVPVERSRGLTYAYVTLDEAATNMPGSRLAKTDTHAVNFSRTMQDFNDRQLAEWFKISAVLTSDPLLTESALGRLLDVSLDQTDEPSANDEYAIIFETLSSGHKIVLLAVTKLVRHVAEGSLVLIDEPETHLHPPLLSAFVRCISELLSSRNGAAIIATHSPVVLQEIPKTCVWRLRRSGNALRARQPTIETFGENVGVLKREIFGLEVTQTGFHSMLQDAVSSGLDFQDVVMMFDGQLGSEARALVQALVAERER